MMAAVSALPQRQRGALPPAFGSPQGICAKMKTRPAKVFHLCLNTHGTGFTRRPFGRGGAA